jgi:acyl carrier protein
MAGSRGEEFRRIFNHAGSSERSMVAAVRPSSSNTGVVMIITEISPRECIAGLVRRILVERSIERPFSAEDDLRAIGLTSLDMVNLVLAVESELAVSIPERDITPANFRSVSSIEALVTALRH